MYTDHRMIIVWLVLGIIVYLSNKRTQRHTKERNERKDKEIRSN